MILRQSTVDSVNLLQNSQSLSLLSLSHQEFRALVCLHYAETDQQQRQRIGYGEQAPGADDEAAVAASPLVGEDAPCDYWKVDKNNLKFANNRITWLLSVCCSLQFN